MDGKFIKKDYPYIVLSESCRIIELSDLLKPQRGLSVDSESALSFLGESDARRLRDFCREPYISPDDSLASLKNSISFSIRYLSYRYAIAVKLPEEYGLITVVYLTDSTMRGYSVRNLLFGRIPQSVASVINGMSGNLQFDRAVSKLISSEETIRICDMSQLLSSLCAKFTSRVGHFNSKLILEGVGEASDGGDAVSQCGRIKLGAFVLIFTSLLSVLDSVTSEPQITVRLNRYSESAEVVLTCDTDANLPIVGSTSDIMSLAGYIYGSCSLLAFSAYTAADNNMYIGFRSHAARRLQLYFGYIPDLPSELEFKYRDMEPELDEALDDAMDIVSSDEIRRL